MIIMRTVSARTLTSHILHLTSAVVVLAAIPLGAHAQRTPSPGSLDSATVALARAPEDLNAIIWHARFVGYTDYERAVELYTAAMATRPDEPWLLRHRGHRLVSLRRFDEAIADLQRAYDLTAGRADEVEPDGQPNPRGIPTSTLKSNIRYHLALAHFLTGNYPAAATYWEEDAKVAANLDHRVAATYWWVLSLARMGATERVQEALAPVSADWEIIENGSYHRGLLWMKGLMSEATLRASMTTPLERQTIGNGMAQWHMAHGRREAALLAVREVLSTGPSASFGFLGAEALAKELGLRQ
jgi:tetratricopeptide (TPR) repeat protein